MRNVISWNRVRPILWILCVGFLAGIFACSPGVEPPTQLPGGVPSTTTPFPPGSLETVSAETLEDIDAWFIRMSQEGSFSGAVLIGQQGEVLLNKGYGQADRAAESANRTDTRFLIGSLTKQFTAMAILLLQSESKVSPADRICDHINDCPPAWKAITIAHLLTHTSGLPDFSEIPLSGSAQSHLTTVEDTLALFEDLPLAFPPGERFRYSNTGYIVLGYIIEGVTGQSYGDYLREAIYLPLGMHNTGYAHPQAGLASGYESGRSQQPVSPIDLAIPHAAGGLYSTVEDLYRWDQALYSDQLLPPNALAELFVPRAAISETDGTAYGYGWIIGENDGRVVEYHGGSISGYAALLARYPAEEIVIIILANQEDVPVGALQQTIAEKLFCQE